ncbi:MAG: N-acetyltransferase [Saprospiraceae bacterium]|nr:MAG: N-acetyltransferase [Saprospiraceae bacterium]
MTIDPSSIKVVNNPEKKRFEVVIDEHVAVAEYMLVKNKIIFTHTEVPKELGGNGIGSKLAKTGLEYAKAEGLEVMPLCPYIAGYIKRNPEYIPLVQKGINIK